MKTKILIIGLIFIAQNLRAQTIIETDSLTSPYSLQIEHIFENVDLTEVEDNGGILYEHGFPLFSIEYFNGTLSDTNIASFDIFSLSYVTLTSMAIDSIYRLPHPSIYRNIADTVAMNAMVIPIAILHQKYKMIDTNAVSDSLFTITGDQIFDVPGRISSPYLDAECFIATPVRDKVKGNSLALSFSSDLQFNNTGKTISALYIDMDDGKGYVGTNLDIPVIATYIENGIKHIKFKIVYTDASVYYSQTKINFENDLLSSGVDPYDIYDEVHHITASESYLGGYGAGNVYISYACGHTSLQKPFIWAEG